MNREDIIAYVRENEPNICQICVWKDGKEIFTEEWNGYKKTDCTHIMSAMKSIMSLLVGIAVDKGMIRSVQEKVISFFRDYTVKKVKRQYMTSRSGIF